jgi:hypothetical protein
MACPEDRGRHPDLPRVARAPRSLPRIVFVESFMIRRCRKLPSSDDVRQSRLGLRPSVGRRPERGRGRARRRRGSGATAQQTVVSGARRFRAGPGLGVRS